MKEIKIKDLIGKTFSKVEANHEKEELLFEAESGIKYIFYHCQDCCESVSIEDICGDLKDLIGSPIIQSEESTSRDNPSGVKIPEYQDSFTWTFYKFATNKGSVTVRWYGASNGYYSEGVSLRTEGDCE